MTSGARARALQPPADLCLLVNSLARYSLAPRCQAVCMHSYALPVFARRLESASLLTMKPFDTRS